MVSGVPVSRATPCAAGPQVASVEVVGLLATPVGAHQPPDDGPLSQRTVEKPSSNNCRFEYAADSSTPTLRSAKVFEIRKAPRGSVLPERSL